MKVEVRIWIGGKAVNEVVIATNYQQHAKEIVVEMNSQAIAMNSLLN